MQRLAKTLKRSHCDRIEKSVGLEKADFIRKMTLQIQMMNILPP